MIIEKIKEIMQKNGLNVGKIILLPSNEINAKYIKRYESFVKLTLIYTGVVVIDGIPIPFIAQDLKGKLHIYLYPSKDFYLGYLEG
ncbi:MAG: hypothetical protein RXR43_15505 [Sulfolobus sp.]